MKIQSDRGWIIPTILSDTASLHGTLALTSYCIACRDARESGDSTVITKGTPESLGYLTSAVRLLNEKLSDPDKYAEASSLWAVAQLLLLSVSPLHRHHVTSPTLLSSIIVLTPKFGADP